MNAPPKTYTEPQAAFQELLFWGLYNSWIELNFCQVREYPRTCMLTYADSIHGNRQCTTLVQNHKIMVVENLRRNWQKYDGYWKHNLIPIPLLILYKIFILWSGIFFQNYFLGGGKLFFFLFVFAFAAFAFTFGVFAFGFGVFAFAAFAFAGFAFITFAFAFVAAFAFVFISVFVFAFTFAYFCFCYFLLIYFFFLLLCCIVFSFCFYIYFVVLLWVCGCFCCLYYYVLFKFFSY